MNLKTSTILFALLCVNLFTNIACDKGNPTKMGMPESYNTVTIQTKTSQIILHPKVDILFVIDNSESMNVHQDNLSANIDSFVKAFAGNESLDYHIGVTSIYDSTRYGSIVKKFVPNGELRPMPHPVPNLPASYYTKEHSNSLLLKEMLKIGVSSFVKSTTSRGEANGPEIEESFSPVMAALSEPKISADSNKGFYRDDAHLVIIFITDASDASPNLSAEQLYSFLLNLKQQDYSKIHTYGVLADANDKLCTRVDPSLKTDGDKSSGKPDSIIDFISMSRGRKLSICQENYGPMLSAMGKEIEVKTSKQVIYLDSIPELSTLCICKVGDDCRTLKEDGTNKCIKEGWKYDPVNISIVINDVAAILKSADMETTDLQLEVTFTPIKIQNVINGRTTRQN
jgi:hypothetical protein